VSGASNSPDFASEEAFEALMGSISTVYGLRPGHVLTQADFDAIQHYDNHHRCEDNRAVEAFHRGYTLGLREGGSSDIEQMKAQLDEKMVRLAAEKAMRGFAESRLDETEQHVRDFIRALDKGFLDCRDDSAFIDALRTIAERKSSALSHGEG